MWRKRELSRSNDGRRECLCYTPACDWVVTLNKPAMPALSILTPVYNGAGYLHRCLDNLLRQTFSDWEWVIVDDGSTDQSKDIVDEFDDARIKLLTYQPNRGRGYARMLGLESCLGDWIVIWDVDDLHC